MIAGTAGAQSVSVNTCAAKKAKCVGAYTKGMLGCHAKAVTKGTSLDAICAGKAAGKLLTCVAKAEAKPPCLTSGDSAALQTDTDAFVLSAVTQLDPGYPVPVVNKCSAGKMKAVAAKAASELGCLAKAFAKTGLVDGPCLTKAATKHLAAFAKLETKPPCLTIGDEAALGATGAAYYASAVAALMGGSGACPTRYEVAIDGTDPATVMDLGWSGIAHREPLATNAAFTVGLGGCGGTEPPCGTCSVTGPVANASGMLANRRCTNDSSIQCTSDAPCSGGGGTCQYVLGPWQGLSFGGIGLCVAYRFTMPAGGTVNIESGEAAIPMDVTMPVYLGIGVDDPCPRCLGDTTNNDGIAGGTCSGGARLGLACDGNGATPAFPDFGTTSLDCPPVAGYFLSATGFELDNVTDPATMTVSSASPDCRYIGSLGEKCLCDTCNNANAERCASNADCPDPTGPVGPICGGKRCIGGTNNGAPCSVNSECPGGGCNLPGEATQPTACIDDTNAPGVFQCADTAPVDGEGACSAGPIDTRCSVASGHPQRGCLVDADCGGGAGTCQAALRPCFLTGTAAGFGTRVGTQTLIAVGAEDVPVGGVSHPTLGSTSCMDVSTTPALNAVFGLPGPQRTTLKVTARALP